MIYDLNDYLGELEVALIELPAARRDACVREVRQIAMEMERAGKRDKDIIRELGPVKKLAREYLRKNGRGNVLDRLSEGVSSALGNSHARARKKTEYYLKFYNKGLYRISQNDLSGIGTWEIIGEDAYRIMSDLRDEDILAYLEQRHRLSREDFELINGETMARY